MKSYCKLTWFLLEKNAQEQRKHNRVCRKMEAVSWPGRDTSEETRTIILLQNLQSLNYKIGAWHPPYLK